MAASPAETPPDHMTCTHTHTYTYRNTRSGVTWSPLAHLTDSSRSSASALALRSMPTTAVTGRHTNGIRRARTFKCLPHHVTDSVVAHEVRLRLCGTGNVQHHLGHILQRCQLALELVLLGVQSRGGRSGVCRRRRRCRRCACCSSGRLSGLASRGVTGQASPSPHQQRVST